MEKSEAAWLTEPGVREIPKKAIEEARELLAQGKDYVRHVVRAWLMRRTVRWQDYEFMPQRLGIEVYVNGEYERMWSNRAIEAVFHKLSLDGEDLEEAKAESKKASDEDQVDVDVVVNVEAPKQEQQEEE